MKLTRNFALEELTSRDGVPVPLALQANARSICERAQKLRDLIQSPLVVSSGYRTASHNKKVGGAKNSEHLTASALDLTSTIWTSPQLALLYQGLIDLGVVPDGGIGLYPPSKNSKMGWIHIDLGRSRRW